MTEREAERLIEVFKRVVEEKLQEISLRPSDVSPAAFEDKYMKRYTHGMYIDHILFRKFLHEVDLAQAKEDLFSQWLEYFTSNATSIAHEDLLALINNNELIPSSSYRITNYTTTTVQNDTTSARHDFDIIVTALSTNELSENAKCVRKSDDSYFVNAKLEAWEIKYCIDNDTNRFAWADTVSGKGVIYYMKDEWNNECPYDFKNIQYLKNGIFLYTFGGTTDNSLTGGCHHNTMMGYALGSVLRLNFNIFGVACSSNTFGKNCHSNTFLGLCYSNTFGNNCYSNTFGNRCSFNIFGNDCNSNTFGDGCYSNTFGGSCRSNTFGDYCNYNTFGNYCFPNTFGYGCNSNTFGNYCRSNNFYHGTSGTTEKSYLRYIVLEDGVSNNNFYSNVETSGSSPLQRIRIKGLEHTTPTDIQITLPEVNTNYEWVICYTSGGELKQYCPDNNDSYKLENIEVSTWNDSNTYTDFAYEAQINISDLTETDFVNVVFGVNEAVSGNYAAAIEQYEGYILIFRSVNTAITIPTIVVTKIDL